MASATTAQLSSKSACIFVLFNTKLCNPFLIDSIANMVCANGTPTLRNTVESVKSRCKRDIGNLADKCSNKAFANPKFPSAFSKLMGFILCGMVDDPTSPFFIFCLK